MTTTIEGTLLWLDEDDGPVVVEEIPNPGGSPTLDLILQQALAEIWMEQRGYAPRVRITIEVIE